MHKIILRHYQINDPIIHNELKKMNLEDWLQEKKVSPSEYFNSLCSSIISQQLSTKAASSIKKKFLNLMGSEKFIAKDILKMEDQMIRDAGISRPKIKYIKDLSLKFTQNEININSLEELSSEEVITELTKVKGIGRWTAEMFLMFTLRRPDIFSYGDLGLKNGIKKLYQIENPTESQISEIVSKWSPYKTYGSIALWNCLDS